MKQLKNVKRLKLSVEDLRGKLEVEDGKYKQYGHLKSRILNAAVKEVNAKTAIAVEFVEIKLGRSVKEFEFFINANVDKEINLMKSAPSSEDNRARLNELCDGYPFESTYFIKYLQSY